MNSAWPELSLASWRDTYSALHRTAQIMGKVKIALVPKLNHFWHSAFLVNVRGFTTGPMPHPRGAFELRLDLIDHALVFETSGGARESIALAGRPIAALYAEVLER